MVAARPQHTSASSVAEDLRKQVIRLLQSHGEPAQSNILVLPQVFLEFLNYDHKMALFLNKLLFWTERTRNPDKWVYKTYKDWFDELGFKESVIRRLIYGDPSTRTRKRTLRDLGVEVRVRRAPNGSPTCHYRIDLEVFLDAIRQFGAEKQRENSPTESVDSTGSITGIPADGSSDSPDMERLESAATLDQKTTAQIPTEEASVESSCASQTEDDNLSIFSHYVNQLGSLKPSQQAALAAELDRLGSSRVGQVLERCAPRARSWNYVVQALANEPSPTAETPEVRDWDEAVVLNQHTVLEQPVEAPPNALQASARVHSPWVGAQQRQSTVLALWEAVFSQLEWQLDRSTFEAHLRGTRLVDFDPDTRTLTLAAPSTYACKLLQQRLVRTVRRIAKDIFGQEIGIEVVATQDWQAEEVPAAQSA